MSARYVVLGAGAVGGVVGAYLHRAGFPVQLVARGAHGEAIRARGLVLRAPAGEETLAIPVAQVPAEVAWRADDVVLLGTKTQDAAAALAAVRVAAGADVGVVCLQNGVESARIALRLFERVLGSVLMLPTTHLEPGVVVAHSAPAPGVVDVGRFPGGADGLADGVAADLRKAGFASESRPDIQRWQYAKLLINLLNAVQAACGTEAKIGALAGELRAEADACFRAAGIEPVSPEEFRARHASAVNLSGVTGAARVGGSSWQSLARGAGSIESDFLNGEIALLGRLHGVPAPRNARLAEIAERLAAERRAPGTLAVEELRRLLDEATGGTAPPTRL